MNRIFKYPLEIVDHQQIEMPVGAKVLSVQEQNGQLCVWAKVDDACLSKEKRDFWISGTGHPCDHDVDGFIGTVQQYGGNLVWHVFQRADK